VEISKETNTVRKIGEMRVKYPTGMEKFGGNLSEVENAECKDILYDQG